MLFRSEKVEDVFNQDTYFVNDVVLDKKGDPIQDATVTIKGYDAVKSAENGLFEVKVTDKKSYDVNFEKAGYVDLMARVVIPSDAKRMSAVELTQIMVAEAPAVTITPEAGGDVSDASARIEHTLAIPAGALTKTTDIAVTSMVPGSGMTPDHTPFFTVDATPSGTKFEVPAVMTVTNPMTSFAFGGLKHYTLNSNGTWDELGDVKLSPNGNYTFEMAGFSRHMVALKSNYVMTASTSNEGDAAVIDNMNNLGKKVADVNGAYASGWEYDSDLTQTIKTQVAGISDSDAAEMATQMGIAITNNFNLVEGKTMRDILVKDVEVSGDSKMTIQFQNQVNKYVFTFDVNALTSDNASAVKVNVTEYNGYTFTRTVEYGSSWKDHSGGSVTN